MKKLCWSTSSGWEGLPFTQSKLQSYMPGVTEEKINKYRKGICRVRVDGERGEKNQRVFHTYTHMYEISK